MKSIIPGIGSFTSEAQVKMVADRVQGWLDELNAGLSVFHDGLHWYVEGGTQEQQARAAEAVRAILGQD